MADFKLSDIARDAVANLPVFTLKQYMVVGQSVPAGSVVPEGAVIGVQITPINNVPIITLVDAVPAELGQMVVGDFDHLFEASPDLHQMVGDPAILTDPVKRGQFVATMNHAAGRVVFTDANADTALRVFKRMQR